MFWHVIGVLVIIGVVASVPSHHASLGFVFGHRLNNTGFASGATGGAFFWLYVLPIGFIPDDVHPNRLRRIGPPG